MKGAGLHPSVFIFSTITVVPALSPRSSLTSDKLAKSWAFLTSWLVILLLFLRAHSFPSHSQPWPKGDPCCTDTLFLSKNLNAGPLALHETGCVLSRAWIQIPQPPSPSPPSCLVISHAAKRVCELHGDPVRGCTFLFTLWEGWGWEGRERGKWRISYWSSATRMGVLYNVELVNCVPWCKTDSNELLFLLWSECICELNYSNLQWKHVCVYYYDSGQEEATRGFNSRLGNAKQYKTQGARKVFHSKYISALQTRRKD